MYGSIIKNICTSSILRPYGRHSPVDCGKNDDINIIIVFGNGSSIIFLMQP